MFQEILKDIVTATEFKEGDMLSPINKLYFSKPISKDNFHAINLTNFSSLSSPSSTHSSSSDLSSSSSPSSSISDLSSSSSPHSSSSDFSSSSFPPSSFSDLSSSSSPSYLVSTSPSSKLCFIDGGSAEIIKAPNLSMFFIRAYAHITLNNKTIKDKKIEFYCIFKTKIKEEKIFYEVNFITNSNDTNANNINTNNTDIDNTNNNDTNNTDKYNTNNTYIHNTNYKEYAKYLPDKEDLELFSYDTTIVSGENRAEISKLGDVVRRFAELRLAKLMTETELTCNDIIILDGNLRATYTNEEKYLNALYYAALKNNIIITAFCKTSNLLTEKGSNIVSVLNHVAELNNIKGCWFYHPIVEIKDEKHRAEMMFVKLNPLSEYIFRYEIYAQQFKLSSINEILSILALNSVDYSFPGYPYGLIKADTMARVSNKECEFLKTKILFSLESSHNFKDLRKSMNALNAHNILDRK
ncbi:DNA double-strand break repair nuclease NurA [Candidatus Woesearchaeota archaeon]|nr:DNA double-strand break repair nuclease NurA [Candidatus Woesearchaeota archaeon]